MCLDFILFFWVSVAFLGKFKLFEEWMYPLGMEYPRESGMVLIPTRFIWRYGGRIVCISGSFTGLVDCCSWFLLVLWCVLCSVSLWFELSWANACLLVLLMAFLSFRDFYLKVDAMAYDPGRGLSYRIPDNVQSSCRFSPGWLFMFLELRMVKKYPIVRNGQPMRQI